LHPLDLLWLFLCAQFDTMTKKTMIDTEKGDEKEKVRVSLKQLHELKTELKRLTKELSQWKQEHERDLRQMKTDSQYDIKRARQDCECCMGVAGILLVVLFVLCGIAACNGYKFYERVKSLEKEGAEMNLKFVQITEGLHMLERQNTSPRTPVTKNATGEAIAALVHLLTQQDSTALMPTMRIKSHTEGLSTSVGPMSLGMRGFVQRRVLMQADGNLVIYEKGMITGTEKPIWATDTDLGNRRSRLFKFDIIGGNPANPANYRFDICDEGENSCILIKKLNVLVKALTQHYHQLEIHYDGMDLVDENAAIGRHRLVTF